MVEVNQICLFIQGSISEPNTAVNDNKQLWDFEKVTENIFFLSTVTKLSSLQDKSLCFTQLTAA